VHYTFGKIIGFTSQNDAYFFLIVVDLENSQLLSVLFGCLAAAVDPRDDLEALTEISTQHPR
jgi:hypothetical protein